MKNEQHPSINLKRSSKGLFIIGVLTSLAFSLMILEFATVGIIETSYEQELPLESLFELEIIQTVNLQKEQQQVQEKKRSKTFIASNKNSMTIKTVLTPIKKLVNDLNISLNPKKRSLNLQLKIKPKVLGTGEIMMGSYPYFSECENAQDAIEQFTCTRQKLMDYLNRNIRYPDIPREMGIEGTVYLSFVINEQGQVEDITILRSVDRAIDNEAVSVLKKAPEFVAGKQNGKAIKVRFEVPINFKLAKN